MATENFEAPVLAYASPFSTTGTKRGCGFLAACAGVVVTGLGQAISGRFWRGVVWFVGTLVLNTVLFLAVVIPRFVPLLILLFPTMIIWSIAGLVDAYICGRQNPRNLLGSPSRRYLAGIVVIVVLLASGRFAHPEIAAALYFRAHVAEAFVISSLSMAPTVQIHDRVLCNKRILPLRWSIVVIDSPKTPGVRLVTRVVGLPGETLQIIKGAIAVDGILQQAPVGLLPYANRRPWGTPIDGPGCGRPITLGAGEYYCLGDNSPICVDSRDWPSIQQHQLGALPASSVVGIITDIYWPPTRWRQLF